MKTENVGIRELNLHIKTIIPKHQYNIDDMVAMFGKRIESAIYYEEKNSRWFITKKIESTKKPMGLIMKKMGKLCKKRKNKDIAEAYRYYYGTLIAPWILEQSPVIDVMYSADIDFAKYQHELAQINHSDDRVIKTNV